MVEELIGPGAVAAIWGVAEAIRYRRRKSNGKPPSACGSNVAATLERSAVIQERTAEVLDRLHDQITANASKIDRVLDRIEREVIPHLKP